MRAPGGTKVVTHFLCAAAGAAIMAGSGAGFLKQSTSMLPGYHTSGASESSSREPENGNGSAAAKSGAKSGYGAKDYRAAWNAIAAEKELTIARRIALQKEILRRWSLVDLPGAMRAALLSPWDGGETEGGVDALMPAFSEAFAKDPEQA